MTRLLDVLYGLIVLTGVALGALLLCWLAVVFCLVGGHYAEVVAQWLT